MQTGNQHLNAIAYKRTYNHSIFWLDRRWLHFPSQWEWTMCRTILSFQRNRIQCFKRSNLRTRDPRTRVHRSVNQTKFRTWTAQNQAVLGFLPSTDRLVRRMLSRSWPWMQFECINWILFMDRSKWTSESLLAWKCFYWIFRLGCDKLTYILVVKDPPSRQDRVITQQ